jgi:hypothetical protein
MVEPPKAKLIAIGFSLELHVRGVNDSWADCVFLLACETSSEALNIRSVPFYLSYDDFGQLACFLENQLQVDCEDRNPFVTYELGFELSISDPDEIEASVQVFVNVGMKNGTRVYAGFQGQVQVSEVQRFANSLLTQRTIAFSN